MPSACGVLYRERKAGKKCTTMDVRTEPESRTTGENRDVSFLQGQAHLVSLPSTPFAMSILDAISLCRQRTSTPVLWRLTCTRFQVGDTATLHIRYARCAGRDDHTLARTISTGKNCHSVRDGCTTFYVIDCLPSVGS